MQTATLSPAAARQGITQNGLKLLALCLMLLDHIYYFFGFTGAIPLVFTWLGRLSAPLFLFSLVEGWAHTRSKTRYFLRIWLLGAGMGAVQYACILMPGLQRADGFFPQNAMLSTFTLILVMLWGVDFVRSRKFLRGLLLLAAPIAWPYFAIYLLAPLLGKHQGILGLLFYTVLPSTSVILDGSLYFILGGVLLYALRGRRGVQAGAWFGWTLLTEGGTVLLGIHLTGLPLSALFTMGYEWMSAFAALLFLAYNGARGGGGRLLGRFFYVFYPAHVYVLYALSCALYPILMR